MAEYNTGGNGKIIADPFDPTATTNSPLPPQPQLFQLEPIDVVDVWQQELVDCYVQLSVVVSGKPQAQAHDLLQQKASESMRSHCDLVNGLIYAVLTDASSSSMHFQYLNIVSRDGFTHALSRLQLVATSHKLPRLRPEVRAQLFWLMSELVKINAAGVDQILISLTRQLRGGDVSPTNLRLIKLVLGFLEANYEWLGGFPVLIATSAYAFGRLILDHSKHLDLRVRESEFVVRLLRNNFVECSMIGRDLVRMLQSVAKIPVFRDLWHNMLYEPQLIRHFAGLDHLLHTPTPKMFLANRLTFEMENKLLFILEHLPFNSFSRNLLWFVHRYLSTPESESLYSDLIRYIICVFHPSNAVLASNIVPRYVFLGGLLRFIRSQVVAANAKLALFYDWLFYDPKTDNIMNIEPGVLIITRSIDKYAYLTMSFVEFLAFLVDGYCPAMALVIRKSVSLVMSDAVEKGVVSSLMPVYEHPRVDVATRRHMHQLFPKLVPQLPVLSPASNNNNSSSNKPMVNTVPSEAFGEEDDLYDDRADADTQEETMAVDEQQPLSLLPTNMQQLTQPALPIAGLTTAAKPPSVSELHSQLLQSKAIAAPEPQRLVVMDPVSRMFQDDEIDNDGQQQQMQSLAGLIGSTDDVMPITAESSMFASTATADGAVMGKNKSPAATNGLSSRFNNLSAGSEEKEGAEESGGLVGNGQLDEDIPMLVSTDNKDSDPMVVSEESTQAALSDPSLWLFGSLLQSFVNSINAQDNNNDVEQLAGYVKEIIDVFAQSEASILSVAQVLALALVNMELEDIETNQELIDNAGGEGNSADAVEHDTLYYIFKAAQGYIDKIDGWPRVLDLVVQLTRAQKDVGFRWLLFSVSEINTPLAYRQYVMRYAQGNMRAALARDLSTLQERFPMYFYQVLPRIYSAFPCEFVGVRGIVKSVVALIDQPQVYRLTVLVSRGHLKLFGHFSRVLAAIVGRAMELDDAFEQVCMWQLLVAELGGDPLIILFLAQYLLVERRLDPTQNSETANGLLSLLRTTPPSLDLIRILAEYYAADNANDGGGLGAFDRVDFSGAVLMSWLRTNKKQVLDLIPAVVSTVKYGEVMLDLWIMRFDSSEEILKREIKDACLMAVAAATTTTNDEVTQQTKEELNKEEEPSEITNIIDEGDKFDHRDGNSTSRKRQNSANEQETSGIGRRMRRTTIRKKKKRRRRNVITSEDDSNSNSNSSSSSNSNSNSNSNNNSSDSDVELSNGRRRNNGSLNSNNNSDLSSLSSPLMYSSSISSVSSEDGE
ncbi:hypothetical protein GGI26_005770 [Coemansia sp. RSA 1358]|nr:hypothetical protein GGI26_005770 [Coemansia sp. RSA 1358]